MRELISSIRPKKQFSSPKKPFLRTAKTAGNDHRQAWTALIRRWSSIMSAIFNLIYREFCIARLAEMRKHHPAGQY